MAYRPSSRAFLYSILPLLSFFAVYHFVLNDYYVFFVLAALIAFELAVILSVHRKPLKKYESLVYYHALNLSVLFLGFYYIIIMEFAGRFEYLPLSLTFIFPAFLIFPQRLKIPSVFAFGVILSLVVYRADPDLNLTGKELLSGYIPSIFIATVFCYLFFHANQKELQVSRDEYSLLFNEAVVGIFKSTREGKFLRVNSAMAQLYGYDSPQDMIDSINDIGSELYADPKDRISFLSELEKKGRVDYCEFQRKRKNGEVFWVSVTSRGIRDAQGKLSIIEGFSQDITSRKNAEETLKTLTGSTVGLTGQDFFDNAIKSVCRWLDCEIGFIGEAEEGNRCKPLALLRDGELRPGADCQPTGVLFRKTMEEGFFHHPDNLLLSFPGNDSLKDLGVRSYVGIRIVDAAGKVLGILSAMSRRGMELPQGAENVLGIIAERARAEIERRRYEEELVRQRTNLEMLIEAAPEAIAVIDKNDKVERINSEFTRLFGYTPQEAVGRAINDLLSFPDVHEETEKNREIVLSGGTIRAETVRRRKDGSTVQVSFLGTRVKRENGIDVIYLIYRDISARKQAEQAQKESYEALVTISDSIDADIYVADFETYEILFMNRHMKESYGDALEGKPCYKAFRNEDAPCLDCTNSQILDEEGRPTGLQVWEGLSSTTNRFYIHYARAVKWVNGRYARLQVSTDVTERKAMEENLVRRVQEMATLNSLGRKVNSSLSLEETVQDSMAEIRTALGSGMAFLFLRHEEDLELAAVDSEGYFWDEKNLPQHKVGECLCGLAASRGEPVYSADISTDPRCTYEEFLKAGLVSFAALPLIAGTEVLGVLGLADKGGTDYSQRAEFLQTMANEIAVGLHNAKLFEQLQDSAAQMEETIQDLGKTQRDLLDSENKFTSFTDHMPAIAFMKDSSGKFVFASRAFKQSLGLDPKDVIGKLDTELWSPEKIETFRRADRRVLRDNSVVETLDHLEDAEGKEHTILNYKFPVPRAGKERLIGSISLDITEQTEAEKAFKQSESVAQALFDLIPDAVLRFKRDGTITFYKSAKGVSPEFFPNPVGKNSREYLSPEAMAEREVLVKNVLEQGNVAAHEYTMDVKGVTHNLEARYIRYDEDEVMAIIQNTTERKSLEAQLAQSQRMEAVGVLASGIAHDFNNILQAISGHTQLLLSKSDLAESHKTRILRIDKTIQRAAEVVRRLLTFSRKGETKFEPLNLNREVRHTVELLKHSLPKMVEIEMDLDNEIGHIYGDSSQIEQVLMNLGVNARDAMPDGGKLIFKTGTVTIGNEHLPNFRDLSKGDYTKLQIIDNGQGMEPEVADRIFEPFYTTKGVGRGTGLGLFTVYGIVRGHKGQIVCDTTPGEGTSFSLLLPALKGRAVLEPQADIYEPEYRAGSGTILIVDDERHIRETGREFFSRSGYEVLTAPDGETALEIYGSKGKKIDLVILDLGMPGMGGQKALSGLLDLNPEVKVIIASGYSVGSQVKEAMDKGAAGYISKPYRLIKLLDKIKETIA